MIGKAGLALRQEASDDLPFLEQLFISTRLAELEPTGWPADVKQQFLASQFGFQRRHYAQAYHDADFYIVQQEDRPVGRLYLFRGSTDIRIVDISLLPEWRGRGLGAALIAVVQAEAERSGCSVSLQVALYNPAQRLYSRLGFVQTGTDGASWSMRWPA